MKVVETLFDSQSGYDSKNILNKSGKRVPQVHLDAIERGVTSEELEAMAKAGLKIFKYKTQITIHGLFPELGNNRIGGYTNLFQNKNQSIGVKYNAIDEEKRARIAAKLKYAGFSYSRTSTDCSFGMSKAINKDNWESVLAEMQAIKAKINMSLFTGGVSLFRAEAWGVKYLCLSLHISIIPESNVQPFIDSLVSESDIEAILEAKRIKDAEHTAYYEAKAQERERNETAAWARAEPQMERLKAFPKAAMKDAGTGHYIKAEYNSYANEIRFESRWLYYPSKAAKKLRACIRSCESLDEALSHTLVDSSSNPIARGYGSMFKVA